MDAARFDQLAIAVGLRTTRRAALGLLTALGVTGLVREEAGAASCLPNGERCGGRRGTCCSGFCKKKRGSGKRFCRPAPHQGICDVSSNKCNSTGINCSQSNSCSCYVTPAGRSFCGSNECVVHNCSSNAECAKEHGPGSICWPAGTNCCGGNKGCIPACSDPTAP